MLLALVRWMRSSSLRIHRKITFSLLSPAFRVFEVFEVFAVYVVFKEVEVCAAVRGDVILKMAHNDSIAGEKICIRFSYLRPQESDNIPQHSRTVHNNPQQFTTSQCNNQQQPTIFEAYNFFTKKLFTPLDLCVSSCWGAHATPFVCVLPKTKSKIKSARWKGSVSD